MNEIDDKASQLARMLTRLQLTANAGQPGIVIQYNARNIQRIAGELADMLEKAPPATMVRMDPTLGPEVANLLREYMDGQLQIPESPAGL